MTSTKTRPELTEVLNDKGEKCYADAGATRQGDRREMKKCEACGDYVAFVQSSSGKWYLADCFPYRGGQSFYYRKDSAHFKTCGERAAKREEVRAQLAYIEARKVLRNEHLRRAEALTTVEEAQAMREWFLAADDELLAAQPEWLQDQINKNLI
jgi:hypothetical protein